MRNAAFLVIVLASALAAAETRPIVLHHHGRLLSSDDQPVTVSTSITIGLFPTKEATTAGWSETYDVQPFNGGYAIAIGADPAKKTLTAADIVANPYLGISIGTVALQPRQIIGTVPFAASATEADHAALADKATNADHATLADTATNALKLGEVAAADFATKAYVDAAAAAVAPTGYAKLDGATFTGAVSVPAPTDAAHATTKAYVDAATAAVAPTGYAKLDGAAFTGAVTVPAPTATADAATKGYVDARLDPTAYAPRSDSRWGFSDPRLRSATKVSSVKLVAQPSSGGARVIEIDGQNVATGDLSAAGLYLVVLDAATHQPVTTDTAFNKNYDVNNSSNGANVAVTLQVALAQTTTSQIVLLVAKGPSFTNFGTFAKDLIARGGVPMSYFTFNNNDLYVFAGKKGLGVTDAVEVIRDQRTGAASAEFLLADGEIVARPELHRQNRLVDFVRGSDDWTGNNGSTDWSYRTLDGKVGPFKFYSTGKPLHVNLKFMNYVEVSGTPSYTYLAIFPVIDGTRGSYCAYAFQRSQDRHADTVCDFTLDLAPGEHTISFDHGHIGYRTIVYDNTLRSRIVLEEDVP